MSSPGPVTKLQRSFAYRVSRLFPSEFLRWIDVVSGLLDGLTPGAGAQANTRFVALNGSDTSGDGSFEKPYLTIAAAMASITLASITNPWLIDVGPGVFATPFTIKNGVTISGKGSGAGSYNGDVLLGTTVIEPFGGNILDSSFAGASAKFAAIENCAFSAGFLADFAAIVSTGEGAFRLQNISTLDNVSFTGAAAGLNAATVRDLYINSPDPSHLTFNDMADSNVVGYINDFGGEAIYIQAAAFDGFHAIAGSFCGRISATSTAVLPHFMIVQCTDIASDNEPAIVGVSAGVIMPTSIHRTMTDAANRLGFGNDATSTIIGVNGGFNMIECTPTANRVLTIVRPHTNVLATHILVRNLATTQGFNIDLAFTAGTLAAGSPSYVPAGGEVRITFDFQANLWMVSPKAQASLVVLTGGVSAFIPADVSVRTSFSAVLATYNGVCGTPYVKSADTVVGTRAGGGGFKVHSITPATGADVATDNGTYWWTAEGL